MKDIQVGGSLTLPQVTAGFMRVLDSDLAAEDLLGFVHQCVDAGVNAFDHAPVYGGFTIEEYFGTHVLAKEPSLRERIKLVSKTGIYLIPEKQHTGIYYDSSDTAIRSEVDRSLRKLHTDYLDLLLIHRPDPMTDLAAVADTLNRLVENGKVKEIGVSNYSPEQVAAISAYLNVPLAANQLELSVANTDSLFDGSIDASRAHGASIMAWSPLAGGRLFAQEGQEPNALQAKLQEIASEHSTTADAIAYAWLFNINQPMTVVTGSMKIERIKAAADATAITLSREEWYGLLEASRGYPVP